MLTHILKFFHCPRLSTYFRVGHSQGILIHPIYKQMFSEENSTIAIKTDEKKCLFLCINALSPDNRFKQKWQQLVQCNRVRKSQGDQSVVYLYFLINLT